MRIGQTVYHKLHPEIEGIVTKINAGFMGYVSVKTKIGPAEIPLPFAKVKSNDESQHKRL